MFFEMTETGIRCWLESASASSAERWLQRAAERIGGEVRKVRVPAHVVDPNLEPTPMDEVWTPRLFGASGAVDPLNLEIERLGKDWQAWAQ